MIKLNCSAKEVWLSIHIKSKEKVNRFHGGTGLPKLATSHFCYCAASTLVTLQDPSNLSGFRCRACHNPTTQ